MMIIMANHKQQIANLQSEALDLYYAGNFSEAEVKYKEILDLNLNNAAVWRDLGMVYYKQSKEQEALEMLYKAIDLDPLDAQQYYSLGLVLEKIGYLTEAEKAYTKAIALDRNWLEAYHSLGNLLSQMAFLEQAESVYIQAIGIDKNYYLNYFNLGNVLTMRQQFDEAIAAYQTALQLKPCEPIILHNLGLAFQAKNETAQASLYFGCAAYHQGLSKIAIDNYRYFLEHRTGDVEVYVNLAECYQNLDLYELAIETYQKALQLYPQEIELYLRLALTLQDGGQTENAMNLIDEACWLFPNEIALQIEQARILPIIYRDAEEIAFYRQRFTDRLASLINHISLTTIADRESAMKAIGWRTNFYLQYQGYNDLELQQNYGNFTHRVMAANYPHWVAKITAPTSKKPEKIRIGYVSDCFHFHTVGLVFSGWLKNCDRANFQTFCYYINTQSDEITKKYQIYSDRFYHIPNNLEAVAERIITDRLDILVFLDIGMVPQMTQLAALRLAPVQCAAWGHPVTSGLPTIDYFISGDLMEPENAGEHYSEQLIKLPNIGISYSKPIVPAPTKTRSDFNLREDAVVYICCQSLFKYLPQYDYILAAIAQQVPQAQFVFISHLSTPIIEQFRQRLQRAFANFDLNSEDYCIILPRQSQIDYWNLNLVGDIFLDTFGFTGFLTTIESIACNLPIVTCPGEFMRSRQSYGILQRLAITETIAQNEPEYIEIAVKLGLQPEWRHSIVEKIQHCQNILYDDRTCVAELEAFYRRVTAK